MHRGDTSPSGPTRRAVTTTRTASGNMRTMNLDIWQMEVSDLSASESLSSVSTACNNNNRRISRRERIRDDSSKEAAAVENNNKRIPRRDRKLNATAAMDSSGTTPQVRIPRKDRRKARRRSPKQTNGAPIQPVDERHSTDAAPRLMRRTTIDTPLNITRAPGSKGSSSNNKSPTNSNSRTGPPLQRRATVDSATQANSQSITINITVRRRRRKSANQQQQLPLNNQLPLHRHPTDASGSSHDNDNSTISTTPSLRRASTVEGALRRIVDTPPPLLRRSSTDFTNSKQPPKRASAGNATTMPAPCCQDHQAPAKPMRRSSISQQQQYPVRRSGTDASDETSVTEREDEFYTYGKHVAVRELQPEQQQASFRRSRTADSLPVIPQRRYSVVSSKKGAAVDHRPAATVHSNTSLQRSLSFSENDCIHPSTSRWGTAR